MTRDELVTRVVSAAQEVWRAHYRANDWGMPGFRKTKDQTLLTRRIKEVDTVALTCANLPSNGRAPTGAGAECAVDELLQALQAARAFDASLVEDVVAAAHIPPPLERSRR
jgi:hypothetical protein